MGELVVPPSATSDSAVASVLIMNNVGVSVLRRYGVFAKQ